jgi:hypothetical protein
VLRDSAQRHGERKATLKGAASAAKNTPRRRHLQIRSRDVAFLLSHAPPTGDMAGVR